MLEMDLSPEVEQFVGAGKYERTGNRRGYRSGSYERQYQTRVGDVNIKMPQTKLIPFSSEVIERYRRREASVEEALIEMYLAGVSTRRVQDITEALFDSAVKPGTVSRLNQQVYEKLEVWRQRPLEMAFPYVYLDGIALKRQWAGEVKNVSVLVAAGVSEDGRREVIGISEGCKEDKEGWRRFLQDLKRRGLGKVTLVVSDACLGLKEALAEVFPDADWQRCIVHFYRNVLTQVPRKKMLADEGIEMISPHRKNRKMSKTQDGRALRRYKRRWLVERFWSWLHWQRRLVVRWEYYTENFLGFVQLASICILLKQVLR